MNPEFWKLKYLFDDTEQTFGEWKITEATRTLNSLAQDVFSFTIRAPFDGAAPFAIDEECYVTRGGAGFFRGRFVRVNRIGAPGNEGFRYDVAGPWWYLDNLAMQQAWKIADNPSSPTSTISSQYRSRIIMFQKLSGARATVTEFVEECADYCIAAGGVFQVGSIVCGSMTPPFSEIRDQTCSEAIRAGLKWRPDAVSWFDYTTDPPSLYMAVQGDLAAVDLTAVGDRMATLGLTPRNDLVLNGVVIHYEAVNSLNEKSWTTITTDAAGTPGFKTAVMTIGLGGSSQTVQTQQITINQIDVTARSFWESLLPWLHQATSVSISDVRINGSLVTGQTSDATDGTSLYPGLGLEDFSGAALSAPSGLAANRNVIVAGQVPFWLQALVTDETVSAKISYTLANLDTGAEEVKEKVPFTAKYKATSLNYSTGPQTFQQTTAYTPAEPIPSGVADAYLAANSVLQYEGDLTYVEEEAGERVGMGKVVNISDGPAEWVAMVALVQTISENLESGQTKIHVGPAKHLGLQDFIERQRVQRARNASYRLAERIDGVFYGSSGAQVNGAIQIVKGAPAASHIPGKVQAVSKIDADKTSQVRATADLTSATTHETFKQNDDTDARATVKHFAQDSGSAQTTIKKTDANESTLMGKVEAIAGDQTASHQVAAANDDGDITAQVYAQTPDPDNASLLVEVAPDADHERIVLIDTDDFDAGALAYFDDKVTVRLRVVDVCMPNPDEETVDETPTIPGKMLVLCSEPWPA